MNYHFITLGCAKNQVDSESMSSLLDAAGHRCVDKASKADVVIVNTCGFIGDAKEESLETLNGFRRASRRTHRGTSGERGSPTRIVAAGCLAELMAAEMLDVGLPVDAVLGTRRWSEIVEVVEAVASGQRGLVWVGAAGGQMPECTRTTRAPSAFVKIADGCSSGCAFCMIPRIKGPASSRSIDSVVGEVRQLADRGVKEIVLIAQDTTAYGRDLGLGDGLPDLVERICDAVPSLPWLRVMYTYPTRISPRLLSVIAERPQVVKYLDVPLQHVSDRVLPLMRRPTHDALAFVENLRKSVPGIAIRSTFIVGHPGERGDDFELLRRFLEEARLDRVGVFGYSREAGTPSAEMSEQVPDRVKWKRRDVLMRLQHDISLENNGRLVGSVMDVLVEASVEAGSRSDTALGDWIGRSYRDAPEVDGLVFVKGKASVGEIVSARVVQAFPYDLVAEVADAGDS